MVMVINIKNLLKEVDMCSKYLERDIFIRSEQMEAQWELRSLKTQKDIQTGRRKESIYNLSRRRHLEA